jgi:hypothetical protein
METPTVKIDPMSLIPALRTYAWERVNTRVLINITAFLVRLFAMVKLIVSTSRTKLIVPALIPCVHRRSSIAPIVTFAFLSLGCATKIQIVNMEKTRTAASAIVSSTNRLVHSTICDAHNVLTACQGWLFATALPNANMVLMQSFALN